MNGPLSLTSADIWNIRTLAVLIVAAVCSLWSIAPAAAQTPRRSEDGIRGEAMRRDVAGRLARLPVSFRENRGQWDPRVLYRGAASGAQISFLRDGMSFAFSRAVEGESRLSGRPRPDSLSEREYLVWNLRFEGAEPESDVVADGRRASRANYLSAGSATAVAVSDYSRVWYRNLYPDIDLRYYGVAHSLKYDYILRPGADVRSIRMACSGIEGLSVNDAGQLEVAVAWGTLREDVPYAYQEIDGRRRPVDVSYVLLNDTAYGFTIRGEYRRDLPLVIDPVMLAWSTYIGGDDIPGDDVLYEGYLRDIVVDSSGFVYGTGWYTDRFPVVPGSFSTRHAGAKTDVMVFKLLPDGSDLVYATYVGGQGNEEGVGIHLLPGGDVVVFGSTSSWDFPLTANAYDQFYHGYRDLFAFRLSRDGSTLLYSTLIGGTGDDAAGHSAINDRGELFMVGVTTSLDFPTTPGVVGPALAASGDIFVVRLNAFGDDLVYATLLGGSDYDEGIDIAVDSADDAFVTGYTVSDDFPVTPGAYQQVMLGDSDAVVCKLAPDGASLLYSTYLGGTRGDVGRTVVLNSVGEAIVGGWTASANFPVRTGGYDLSFNANPGDNPLVDGFVCRLNVDGSKVVHSTYLGGIGRDHVEGIALDRDENLFVVGSTTSLDFPTTGCAFPAGYHNGYDIFVARLDPDLGTLYFSTLIGGRLNDYGGNFDYENARIRLIGDSCNVEAVVSLTSHSPDFPTTPGVFEPRKLNSNNDVQEDQPVVFRLKPVVQAAFSYDTSVCGIIKFRNESSLCTWDDGAIPEVFWDFGDGETSGDANPNHQYAAPGTYRATLVTGCPSSSITQDVVVPTPVGVAADAGEDAYVCIGASAQLLARAPNAAKFEWAPDIGLSCTTCSNPFVSPTETTRYYVTITDADGCVGTDSVTVFVVTNPIAAVSPDTTLCLGGSATLVAGGGASYRWEPSAGLSCADCQTTVASPTVTTQYRVIVTGDASCRGADTAFVTVVVDPLPKVGVTGDTVICPGASVPLNAFGGVSYRWEPSDGLSCVDCSNPTASPATTTRYVVAVSNAEGCTDTSSVLVTVDEGERVDAGPSRTLCRGDSVRLSASGPGPFFWSPSDGLSCADCAEPFASPMSTTLYTVSSSGSCGSSDTVTVTVLPVPVVSAGSDTVICSDGAASLHAEGGVDYLWSPAEGVDCPTCDRTTAHPSVTTRYTVRITSVEGCVVYDTVTVTVDSSPLSARAHIPGNLLVAADGTVVVPVVLDDALDGAGIDEMRFELRYDKRMLRIVGANVDATQLVGWSVEDITNDFADGVYTAWLRAPVGSVLQGTGTILNIRVLGFIGAVDTSALEFSLDPQRVRCTVVLPTPGLIRLDSLCALNLRLIESTGESYTLDQNRPNPFNPTTEITFSLGLDGPTRLEVLDALGRHVTTLLEEALAAGRYAVTWDATAYPSGLYYYRLTSGAWTHSRSMMLVK